MPSVIGSELKDTAENVLGNLLEKIRDFVADQFSLMLSLEEELNFLRSIHPKLMEVVVNAEVPKDETKVVLMAVKVFYYDGKDVVEEFDTEVACQQLNGARLSDLGMEGHRSWLFRLKARAISVVGEQKFEDFSLFLKPLCGCFFPDDFSFFFFRWKIANKIKDLYDKLKKTESFATRMEDFMKDKEQWLPNERSSTKQVREVVDEMLPKDFRLVGREVVTKEIKDLLLNQSDVTSVASSSHGSTSTIPHVRVLVITGMGGIGKTTLIQAIYNDPDVEKHFQALNKWVCVGDDELDPNKVMEKIFKKENQEDAYGMNRKETQECADRMNRNETEECADDTAGKRKQLRSTVEGKRFLIVLDDVWRGEHLRSRWEKLWDPFSYGAEGSWIIITTRQEDVKNQMGLAPVKEKKLNPLGDEECFQIFHRYAFSPIATASSSSNVLEKLATRIVREKIKGVPLAARVVGSSLLDQPEEMWKQALGRIKEDDIMSAFMWSYRYLPTHLKQCFAYFSIYPKDATIREDELVNHWMAFGYLEPVDGIYGDTEMRPTLEDVGRMYIKHLVRASLLEPSQRRWSNLMYSDVSDRYYIMHDLIHDLAMDVSDHKAACGNKRKPYYGGDNRYPFRIQDGLWGFGTSYYSHLNTFKDDQLQTVRILSIGRNISLPTNFPNLVHLRFLNLSSMDNLNSLSESVCDLYNLQVLNLPKNLKKLPEGMWKLVNLRHIYHRRNDINFARVPRVGELTSLQTMTRRGYFGLYKNGGECIRQLKDMKQLRGRLQISGLCHVTNIQWARDAELGNKAHLLRLILDMQISTDLTNEEDEEVSEVSEIELFDNLKPHRNLEKLEVIHYRGDELPAWLRGCYLSNIVDLTLSNCYNLTKLPPLGHLGNLQRLEFCRLDCIERIGAEVYSKDPPGGKPLFPSLKKLCLENMDALEEWEEPIITDSNKGVIKCFPLLEKLVIKRCNKFRCPPTISSVKLRNFSVGGPVLDDVVKWLNQMSSSLSDVSLSKLDIGAKLTLGSHFDKLKHLYIHDMSKLRSLDIQGLPLLSRLSVQRCEHLEVMVLPNPSSFHLSIVNCNALKVNGGSQDVSEMEFAGMWRSEVNDEANQLYALQNIWNLHTDSWEILKAVNPQKLIILILDDLDFGLEMCSDDQKWLMSWFQKLSYIQFISIGSPKVRGGSFPSFLELQNLLSLRSFTIDNCPQLRALPKLPSSLEKSGIFIKECPLLEEGDI